MHSLLIVLAYLVLGLVAAQRSAPGVYTKGNWIVDNKYSFQKNSYFDFSKATSLPAGLKASNYPVDTYTFSPANVIVGKGYLQLWVKKGSFSSAEVTTTSKIKYASVRTVAILSEPAGVCNGMFFYQSDTQETDIEFLLNGQSNSNTGTRYLWLSNQAVDGSGLKTTNPVALPANPTATEHEYRLDWLPGLTNFYVDGKLVWSSTKNIPSVAGT
ncbi:Beta-glucanase [Colletotrichum shisoi]|uniref:Beta-glucanase n=1 Tax=Colletotrichum shisoi TaxID=2078593 RepID=A0A5Q4BBP3_9PEZI|nr:Beta-glucanase [Colletotrichum shisoi]